MNDNNDIISGFDGKAHGGGPFAVDFAMARKLDRSGSTCDAYECMVQRRRVFVKRLKVEYRDNPLYRAAFDKEYDLGVSLSHPSLPRYIGFGADYIAMDFIEGYTLADLIKRGDARLRNRKYVRRLLLELVNVVEYLHRRNIVHCDIKTDNVIVSPYDDRPATLIDLDKAYTSWLGTTHGNTQKYGCEGCADGAIDFRGIGKIAAQLGFDSVARACDSNNVSPGLLKHCLKSHSRWWPVAICAAVAAVAVLYFTLGSRPSGEAPAESSEIDTIAPQPQASVIPQVKVEPVIAPEPVIDKQWIHRLVRERTDSIILLQNELQKTINDTTLTRAERVNLYWDYEEKFSRIFYGIISTAVEHHPRSLEIEVQKELRENPQFKSVEQTNLELTRQACAQ